jgi:hypothetical protein
MTGRPPWLRRPPPETRKAAHLARSAHHAERNALLALLRTEAASQRASAFGLLSADTASKVAAARSRYKGDELVAALDAIHAQHAAAERTLSAKLDQAARARRRVLLAALREKRRAHNELFRAAAHTQARKSTCIPKPHARKRRQLRTRPHTRKLKH